MVVSSWGRRETDGSVVAPRGESRHHFTADGTECAAHAARARALRPNDQGSHLILGGFGGHISGGPFRSAEGARTPRVGSRTAAPSARRSSLALGARTLVRPIAWHPGDPRPPSRPPRARSESLEEFATAYSPGSHSSASCENGARRFMHGLVGARRWRALVAVRRGSRGWSTDQRGRVGARVVKRLEPARWQRRQSVEPLPVPLAALRVAWTWDPVWMRAVVSGVPLTLDGDQIQVFDGDRADLGRTRCGPESAASCATDLAATRSLRHRREPRLARSLPRVGSRLMAPEGPRSDEGARTEPNSRGRRMAPGAPTWESPAVPASGQAWDCHGIG
jgi:hypothetical protein